MIWQRRKSKSMWGFTWNRQPIEKLSPKSRMQAPVNEIVTVGRTDLIAGLLEVQRLAPQHSLAQLTGIYYSIAYVGFGTPYLLAVASVVVGYPLLLLASAGLASMTAAWTQRASFTPATR